MSTTKTGVRHRPEPEDGWEAHPHTVRYREGLYARVKAVADTIPMSVNEFVNQVLEGAVEMVGAPDDQKIPVPPVVVHARFMKTMPKVVVSMRKV